MADVFMPFYESMRDIAEKLSKEDAYDYIMACADYYFDGTEPELDGMVDIAFTAVRHSLDKRRKLVSNQKKRVNKRWHGNAKDDAADADDQPVDTDSAPEDTNSNPVDTSENPVSTNETPVSDIDTDKDKDKDKDNEEDNDKHKDKDNSCAVAQCVSQEPAPKRFVPPSHADVTEYAIERGDPPSQVDAFIDHYTSNGWRVGGKSPMKDWKASWRQWMRRRKSGDFSGSHQTEYKQPLRKWDDVPVTRVEDDWLEGYDLGN